MKRLLLMSVIMLMVVGCSSSSFKADLSNPVDASLNIGQMQVIANDSGVLYDWFVQNNAWNKGEARVIEGDYREMINVMEKLRRKAIAGETDYHRLLYAMEDLTEVWLRLRPELQLTIDIFANNQDLLHRLAVASWNTLSGDMDALLSSVNVTLKNAERGMDAATYAAFKADAQGILKTLSPLIKMVGIPGL